MNEENSKKRGWFEELYGKSKEGFDFLKKGTRKKSLRLKFESYYNRLEDMKISKDTKIGEFREKAASDAEALSDSDIKELCQNKADIRSLEKQMTDLKEEYFEAFGKQMKVEEE